MNNNNDLDVTEKKYINASNENNRMSNIEMKVKLIEPGI